MPLDCNIDARGKAARLTGGLVLLGLSSLLGLATAVGLLGGVDWPWFVAGGLFLAGAFAVFEARAGWCAVRAMGIRTRI